MEPYCRKFAIENDVSCTYSSFTGIQKSIPWHFFIWVKTDSIYGAWNIIDNEMYMGHRIGLHKFFYKNVH